MAEALLRDVREFLLWIGEKIRLNARTNDLPVIWERDVWWVALGENIGSETRGKNQSFERPVIIVKKLSTSMFLGVPTTSREKSGSWFVPCVFGGRMSAANVSQVRSLSHKRLLRKIGSVDYATLHAVRHALVDLLLDKSETRIQ